jgi:GcrA cell cycle regulator
MSWTDERVELLKKMWGEGQSASQIAKELGGVTRNAVIGKVHRLGLSNRTSGAANPETKPKVAPKADPKPKVAPKPAEPAARSEPDAAPKPLPAR